MPKKEGHFILISVTLLTLSFATVLINASTRGLFALVVVDPVQPGNVTVECISTVGKINNIKFGKLRGINNDNLIQHHFEGENSKRSRTFRLETSEKRKFGGIYFCEQKYKRTNTRANIITHKRFGTKALHKVVVYNKEITLEATDFISSEDPFTVWTHNEKRKLRHLYGLKTIQLSKVNFNYSGIYNYGSKNEIQLTVKECDDNFYGDQCFFSGVCFNGGLANDYGCVCPAGFVGLQCEKACNVSNLDVTDANYKICRKDPLVSEKIVYLCLPYPFGCTCHTGFHGVDCKKECLAGFYGPDCVRKCNCKNGGSVCNRFTGQCIGGCKKGYMGPMCQIKECKAGSYGEECSKICHCLHPLACHPVTGACQTGCLDGWTGQSCNIPEKIYNVNKR